MDLARPPRTQLTHPDPAFWDTLRFVVRLAFGSRFNVSYALGFLYDDAQLPG